jgi:hypothetical protein
MSQQQDSQGSSSQFEDYEEQYPLSSPWLVQGKGRTHEGPKSEHPSTYDESIPPLSYHAQDYGQASSLPSSSQIGASPRVEASPTPTSKTGTLKMAYHPYRQYTGGRQVPPWARPQQNTFGSAWPYVWLIIGILAFPMLCFILINVVIPLIVITVLGALLFACLVIVILWIVGKIDHILPPSRW